MDGGGEWCTYVQAAQRLHKSHGAIRQMALRGQLQRVRGNDGKARVLVLPDMERAAHVQAEQMDERPESVLSVQPERAAHVQRTDGALSHALESHIKALQADNEALKQELAALAELAAEQARTTQASAALEAHVETLKAQLAAAEGRASEEAGALREHNTTLKADVEKLEALLATERARADKAIAAAEARAGEESAWTAQAIAAFQSLAERLEAIAEARRPWWRRLAGYNRVRDNAPTRTATRTIWLTKSQPLEETTPTADRRQGIIFL